jgi:acetyltransferase-like isoleucine patch superfamily enzyme
VINRMMNLTRIVYIRCSMMLFLRPLGVRFGKRSTIYRPIRIDGGKSIQIGAKSLIQRGTWLYASPINKGEITLSIGSRCVVGYNNHFVAIRSVVIGDGVLTANNVYISDNSHNYEDIARPIVEQGTRFIREVFIGSGSWLGENVCVIGASVGKNSVIGANSVVTRDVPDFCVAVGAPAVVIKHYDHVSSKWVEGIPSAKTKSAQ